MQPSTHSESYSLYWRTWLFLLGLTLAMIATDSLAIPRPVLLAVLLGAMLVKATLIAAHFMHLRYENRTVAIGIAVSLLAVGLILFLLILPDGLRVLRLGTG